MRVLIFLLLVSISTHASNYVVIGAFANKDNAVQLAKEANAQYDINSEKQLYYVFVLKTESHEEALNAATKLQAEGKYKDAWVFDGYLGNDKPVIVTKEEIKEQVKEVVKEDVAPAVVVPTAPTILPGNAKLFFFNVTFESGSRAPGSEITIVEPKSRRKEYTFNGNEDVTLKPINQTGEMRLECDLVGYRKIIQTINFKSPDSTDGVVIQDNKVIVPFMLVRLKKGDTQILYNVLFYKDAAIMRPESRTDLDGLLAMMNENPKYKIRIHGHTNGGAAGKIIAPGDAGDPFSLKGADEGSGSAKKLSEKRAEVIQKYLSDAGIDPSRMTVKAWGGKKPIYDKMHTQAYANVRVEVEVLED